MKPVIGIIGPRRFNKTDPFECQTRFVDNFAKRIIEAGGIPVGLFFPSEKFNKDILDLCDGLIFQGGPHLGSSHICAMHYAYMHKIPVLGVCLGMQTMAGYEWYRKNYNDKLSFEDIENNFKYEDESKYLYDKNGHNNLDPFDISKIDVCSHKVILDKNSKLYNIYKDDIYEPSLHNSMARDEIFEGGIFKIVGRSLDGVIEALECKDSWMIGVQFHPELENKNLKLFKEFIKQCNLTKK